MLLPPLQYRQGHLLNTASHCREGVEQEQKEGFLKNSLLEGMKYGAQSVEGESQERKHTHRKRTRGPGEAV